MRTQRTRKLILMVTALALTLMMLTACATPANTPAGNAAQTDAQTTVSAGDQAAATTDNSQNSEATGVYQVITAEKAKQIMDNEQGIIIVDVREPSEYKEGHLKGATLLPLGDIATKAATVLPDKDATLLVYCRSGRRSQMGANALLSLGYTKVLDMGGIMSWPYEVVKD